MARLQSEASKRGFEARLESTAAGCDALLQSHTLKQCWKAMLQSEAAAAAAAAAGCAAMRCFRGVALEQTLQGVALKRDFRVML